MNTTRPRAIAKEKIGGETSPKTHNFFFLRIGKNTRLSWETLEKTSFFQIVHTVKYMKMESLRKKTFLQVSVLPRIIVGCSFCEILPFKTGSHFSIFYCCTLSG